MVTAANDVLEDAQQQINETVLKLAIPFLSIRDMLAVSVTNHHLLQHVQSRHDVWTHRYQSFQNHPFFDESVPCLALLCAVNRLNMRIPLRIHGKKVKLNLCQSHPLDRAARQHQFGPLLYLIKGGWDIDDESGELLDVFVVEETNDFVYLPRDFPVYCKDCETSLGSMEELIEHCSSEAHLFANMPRLVDPRSQESFHDLSAFEKTITLTIYSLTVKSVLRDIILSSNSQEAMDGFTRILQRIMQGFLGSAMGPEAPDVSDFSSDVISGFCIDYATDGFFTGDKYALFTINEGWHPTFGYFLDGLGSYVCNRMFDCLLPDQLKEGETNRVLRPTNARLVGLYLNARRTEE
ncbi:MAG: hypothetical protein SGBAC_011887 [Bacillariaceae sp.]